MSKIRALLVETDEFERFFCERPEDREIYKRFKQFNGNRRWAKERYDAIKPYFTNIAADNADGLTDDEYEQVISAYEPRLDQTDYETNVIRNVKFGYAMCGLTIPTINNFGDALEAATELEGQYAIVQS